MGVALSQSHNTVKQVEALSNIVVDAVIFCPRRNTEEIARELIHFHEKIGIYVIISVCVVTSVLFVYLRSTSVPSSAPWVGWTNHGRRCGCHGNDQLGARAINKTAVCQGETFQDF